MYSHRGDCCWLFCKCGSIYSPFPSHPASYVSPSIPLHRHSSKLSGIALTVSRSLVTYYSLMWIRSDLSSSTLWGGIPSVSGFCSFELCYNTHPWTVQFQSRRGSWMFFITSHNFTVETQRIRKGRNVLKSAQSTWVFVRSLNSRYFP